MWIETNENGGVERTRDIGPYRLKASDIYWAVYFVNLGEEVELASGYPSTRSIVLNCDWAEDAIREHLTTTLAAIG
jgi:hypothetical protein